MNKTIIEQKDSIYVAIREIKIIKEKDNVLTTKYWEYIIECLNEAIKTLNNNQ